MISLISVAFSLASPSSMLKLAIEEEAMYLSVFYSCICSCLCRGVNEFGLGFGFVWPEAKESHFFSALLVNKGMFYSQLILSEWL